MGTSLSRQLKTLHGKDEEKLLPKDFEDGGCIGTAEHRSDSAKSDKIHALESLWRFYEADLGNHRRRRRRT